MSDLNSVPAIAITPSGWNGQKVVQNNGSVVSSFYFEEITHTGPIQGSKLVVVSYILQLKILFWRPRFKCSHKFGV